MQILRAAVLTLAAVGNLIVPSGYAQGTIVYVVPPVPVSMYGPPWLWESDFDLDGNGTADYRFDYDGAVFYVSALGNNRQIAYPAVGRDMGSYLTPLFAGEVVGSSLDPILGQWVDQSSPNHGFHSAISYQFNIGGGGPFYGQIAYMGIDFLAADGGQHFGWIKIDNSLPFAGAYLVEWAWAATPGESIFAGQVPEPSPLALFGVAGLALISLRRR
jgi:hypothetical protein